MGPSIVVLGGSSAFEASDQRPDLGSRTQTSIDFSGSPQPSLKNPAIRHPQGDIFGVMEKKIETTI